MRVRRVAEILTENKTVFSFEFFPPKTKQAWELLLHNIQSYFLPLSPAYVSVTYGAGGSTRTKTHELVTTIQNKFNIIVVAHLTCIGSLSEDIDNILLQYDKAGIRNILALRGDPPKNTAQPQNPASYNKLHTHTNSDFPHAADLVAYVRKRYPHFSIGVAGFPEGHPETPNRIQEIELLKEKIQAGADYIVTQLFFDNRDYFDYVERLRLAEIHVPVIPGIMPITNKKGMLRMAELAAGARFPAALLHAISQAKQDISIERIGIQWATSQISDLLNHNVKGIHLYTLNKSSAAVSICRNVGLNNY